MKRFRNTYGGERLQFNTIKLFMDGINENRSGGMLEPYTDDPGYVANTMLTVDELRDFLIELNQEKLDLHVHTIGDLAVRTVIDAVEAAKDVVKESQSRICSSSILMTFRGSKIWASFQISLRGGLA